MPPGFLEAWAAARPAEEAIEAWRFLRSEDEVMSPAGMRAMTPTPLSFAHTLVRRMERHAWQIRRHEVAIDASACGTVIYEIDAEGATFHFAIRARPTPSRPGDGRLRENEFDFLGTLIDGPVDRAYLERDLAEAVDKVWRGRSTNRTLGWTFANRSARLFEDVVAQLAAGRQPHVAELRRGSGYLLRNAGFYGNGRHATRAWSAIPRDHPLAYPYHVDLLCLYLWRTASFDIVEAAATARSGSAVRLADQAKRVLGIGNSSGIGTIAALVRWPAALSAMMLAREFALAHAKARRGPVDRERVMRLGELVDEARRRYDSLPPRSDALEQPNEVAAGLGRVAEHVDRLADGEQPERPWAWVSDYAARGGSREAAEQVNALLLELYPEVTEALIPFMGSLMSHRRRVAPEPPVTQLLDEVEDRYAWALDVDFEAPGAREHFWYKSEENGENRRGVRAIDPGVEFETFVDVAGAVQRLRRRLVAARPEHTVGRFLVEAPEEALVTSRVQLAARMPYSEIRANVIDARFRPSDAIGCFLSILGIERPEPASVQWVRGVFFQAAPLAEEIASRAEDRGPQAR
jgi:hypothetical protein